MGFDLLSLSTTNFVPESGTFHCIKMQFVRFINTPLQCFNTAILLKYHNVMNLRNEAETGSKTSFASVRELARACLKTQIECTISTKS